MDVLTTPWLSGVLLLTGCTTTQPTYRCVGDERIVGARVSTSIDVDIVVSEQQREAVQRELDVLGPLPAVRADNVSRALSQNAAAPAFWARLRAVSAQLSQVETLLRSASQSPAATGIPYARCALSEDCTAPDCGSGPWLLRPDHPHISIQQCLFEDGKRWSPGEPLPPPSRPGSCALVGCQEDNRSDVAASTAAVLASGSVWGPQEESEIAVAVYLLYRCLSQPEAGICADIQPCAPAARTSPAML